jgi:hypothetical protein
VAHVNDSTTKVRFYAVTPGRCKKDVYVKGLLALRQTPTALRRINFPVRDYLFRILLLSFNNPPPFELANLPCRVDMKHD